MYLFLADTPQVDDFLHLFESTAEKGHLLSDLTQVGRLGYWLHTDVTIL